MNLTPYLKILAACFALGFFGLACGGGSSRSSERTNTTSTSSSETCLSSHFCLGETCECTTTGRSGESCSDEDSCEDECEVCQ